MKRFWLLALVLLCCSPAFAQPDNISETWWQMSDSVFDHGQPIIGEYYDLSYGMSCEAHVYDAGDFVEWYMEEPKILDSSGDIVWQEPWFNRTIQDVLELHYNSPPMGVEAAGDCEMTKQDLYIDPDDYQDGETYYTACTWKRTCFDFSELEECTGTTEEMVGYVTGIFWPVEDCGVTRFDFRAPTREDLVKINQLRSEKGLPPQTVPDEECCGSGTVKQRFWMRLVPVDKQRN